MALLWSAYREMLVNNTCAMCQIHLSSRSYQDASKLHHLPSSSHIPSDQKNIAAVTEAKHGIHSKPRARFSIFFFFKGWQISLLKSELLVIHLLQWWFSWLLTSNRKHCSPSQNKSSLCCSNLSISANNSHSCSNWVHVAPVTLELLPADTWMFMTGWCFHLVPG